MRIKKGIFEGYTRTVTSLDEKERTICFLMLLFERSVELCLDFDTAADILDVADG